VTTVTLYRPLVGVVKVYTPLVLVTAVASTRPPSRSSTVTPASTPSPASKSASWLLSRNTVPVNDAAAPVMVAVAPVLPGSESVVVVPMDASIVEVPEGGWVYPMPMGPTDEPAARLAGIPFSVITPVAGT